MELVDILKEQVKALEKLVEIQKATIAILEQRPQLSISQAPSVQTIPYIGPHTPLSPGIVYPSNPNLSPPYYITSGGNGGSSTLGSGSLLPTGGGSGGSTYLPTATINDGVSLHSSTDTNLSETKQKINELLKALEEGNYNKLTSQDNLIFHDTSHVIEKFGKGI